MSGLIYSLIIGAVAGWLAGKFMKGGGFGVLINIILGIVGGLIAGWLFTTLKINFIDGIIGDILKGAIGASLLLFVAGLINNK